MLGSYVFFCQNQIFVSFFFLRTVLTSIEGQNRLAAETNWNEGQQNILNRYQEWYYPKGNNL